jgi:hypothetical protein
VLQSLLTAGLSTLHIKLINTTQCFSWLSMLHVLQEV